MMLRRDGELDIKVMSGDPFENILFQTPSGQEYHSDLDCYHLQTKMGAIFGYDAGQHEVTCNNCLNNQR